MANKKLSKKEFIETLLAKALCDASSGEIVGLVYEKVNEVERVTIKFDGGGFVYANVTCDSKMACIKDIMKAIDW